MEQSILHETEKEVRQKCANFLGGQWMTAKPEDIKVERLAGLANSNFTATLTTLNEETNHAKVPKKVVIHFYGGNVFGKGVVIKYNGEAGEAVLIDIMSLDDLSPKLLGVFPSGRIEEFVPSRNVILEDFEVDTSLSTELGVTLARIHASQIPIRKPADRLQVMYNQVKNIPVKAFENVPNEYLASYSDYKDFPLETEVTFVSNMFAKLEVKPVFSHNDFHLDNILLRQKPSKTEQRLLPVDYELSSYFYRGYDFAYHYASRKRRPKILPNNKIEMEYLEDKHEDRDKKLMIDSYLNEWKKLRKNSDNCNDTIDHLLMEIECAHLAVALVFYCYTRLSQERVEDPSGFIGLCRLTVHDYEGRKASIVQKYKHLFDD